MTRILRNRSAGIVLVGSLALASVASAWPLPPKAPPPKVRICHFPPGNPDNAQVLLVSALAVPAHLILHDDAVCPAGASDCCFKDENNHGHNQCRTGDRRLSHAFGSSVCTDFQTDPNNCGGCGDVCAPGTSCTNGTCQAACPPGTTLCSGACVDQSTDSSNCGACGKQCAPGTTCIAGSCACPAGTILCNGVCVDPAADANNCGACGNICAAGASCASGQCTCPSGTTPCGGVCVDEKADPSNCGACGNACSTGATCNNGVCVSPCPPGTTLCGGVCVNEKTDATNCGACGNSCPSGTTCAGGACQSVCPPGTALCGSTCVDQNTDPNHCGSCGTVCSGGTTCTGGKCVSTEVAGSCLPSSSLGVLIQGTSPAATVTAYVPLGSWSETTLGVIAVPIEPLVGAPTVIATAGPVNACSSNGATGITVCTGNSNDVYVLNGTTLVTTLTAHGTGSQNFSGGACVTCGVATDAGTGRAWLAEGTVSATGQLESLDPVTSAFGAPLDLFGETTSEDISIDPVRHLILSAVETGNFQIIDTTTGHVFNSALNFGLTLNATAEDCITGIAVAPGEFSASMVLVDLTQAVYTPGAPGTWSAPALAQDFSPDFLSFTAAGLSGVAVAPGSHLVGVTDEFGGGAFGVVQLPATSGVGIPSAVDFVAATMPNDPSGGLWSMGLDPHTMTAYTSPNSGTAILAVSNVDRTFLALVDMQALLGAARTPGTHTVDPSVDLVGSGIVTFVAE
jgi:hypothetical protein